MICLQILQLKKICKDINFPKAFEPALGLTQGQTVDIEMHSAIGLFQEIVFRRGV